MVGALPPGKGIAMKRRELVLAALLFAGAAPAGVAQRPEVRPSLAASSTVQPRAFGAPIGTPHLLHMDTAAIRPSRWREGGVIGGTVIGVLAAVAAYSICSDRESGCHGHRIPTTASVFAVGFGVGFSVGALVGGQFPKKVP